MARLDACCILGNTYPITISSDLAQNALDIERRLSNARDYDQKEHSKLNHLLSSVVSPKIVSDLHTTDDIKTYLSTNKNELPNDLFGLYVLPKFHRQTNPLRFYIDATTSYTHLCPQESLNKKQTKIHYVLISRISPSSNADCIKLEILGYIIISLERELFIKQDTDTNHRICFIDMPKSQKKKGSSLTSYIEENSSSSIQYEGNEMKLQTMKTFSQSIPVFSSRIGMSSINKGSNFFGEISTVMNARDSKSNSLLVNVTNIKLASRLQHKRKRDESIDEETGGVIINEDTMDCYDQNSRFTNEASSDTENTSSSSSNDSNHRSQDYFRESSINFNSCGDRSEDEFSTKRQKSNISDQIAVDKFIERQNTASAGDVPIAEEEIIKFKNYVENNQSSEFEFLRVDIKTRTYTTFLISYAELFLDFCKINRESVAYLDLHPNLATFNIHKDRFDLLKNKNVRLDAKWKEVIDYRRETPPHANEYINAFASFVGYERLLGKKGPIVNESLEEGDRIATPFEFINSWSALETFIDTKDMILEGHMELLADCDAGGDRHKQIAFNNKQTPYHSQARQPKEQLEIKMVNLLTFASKFCERMRVIMKDEWDPSMIGLVSTKFDVSSCNDMTTSAIELTPEDASEISAMFSPLVKKYTDPVMLDLLEYYVVIPLDSCLKCVGNICAFIKRGYCVLPISLAFTNVVIPVYYEQWSKYTTTVRDATCLAFEGVYHTLSEVVDPSKLLETQDEDRRQQHHHHQQQEEDVSMWDAGDIPLADEEAEIDLDEVMYQLEEQQIAGVREKDGASLLCDIVSAITIPLKLEINEMFKRVFSAVRTRGNIFSNNTRYHNHSKLFKEEDYGFNATQKFNPEPDHQKRTNSFGTRRGDVDIEDMINVSDPSDVLQTMPLCLKMVVFKLESERHVKHYDRLFLILHLISIKMQPSDITEYFEQISSGNPNRDKAKSLMNDVKNILHEIQVKTYQNGYNRNRKNNEYTFGCDKIMKSYPSGNVLGCPYSNPERIDEMSDLINWIPPNLSAHLRRKKKKDVSMSDSPIGEDGEQNEKHSVPLSSFVESEPTASCSNVQKFTVKTKSHNTDEEYNPRVMQGTALKVWKTSLQSLIDSLANLSVKK